MRPVLGVVGVGARVGVHKAVFQGPIDQNRELACGGGDRLGFADADSRPIGPSIGRLGDCAEGAQTYD